MISGGEMMLNKGAIFDMDGLMIDSEKSSLWAMSSL